MEEVRPGLWIGNIRAVAQLNQICRPNNYDNCNDAYDTRWTVITVLRDIKLLQFVRNTIAEYQKGEQNDMPKSFEIVEHVEWILPDAVQADFVSLGLLNIVETINNAIHPTINYDIDSEKVRKDAATSRRSDGSLNNNVKVIHACFVHCAQGISRSAAVIAAFLLYSRECTTVQEALHAIRVVQPCAQPNLGLLAGLHALEQCDGNIEAAMERMKRHEKRDAQKREN